MDHLLQQDSKNYQKFQRYWARGSDHLLNGIEIRIVEVTQEPEDTGTQNFPQKENKRRKVKSAQDSHQPVQKHRSPRRLIEILQPILLTSKIVI